LTGSTRFVDSISEGKANYSAKSNIGKKEELATLLSEEDSGGLEFLT
jgi:hypothetical protein